jgi:hypothetical protein
MSMVLNPVLSLTRRVCEQDRVSRDATRLVRRLSYHLRNFRVGAHRLHKDNLARVEIDAVGKVQRWLRRGCKNRGSMLGAMEQRQTVIASALMVWICKSIMGMIRRRW